MVKCAFFDFDDTIVHGDSIVKLLKYALKKHPLSVFRFLKTLLYALLYVLHLVTHEQLKETILFPLRLLNDKELEVFYQTSVMPDYYPHMAEEMQKRKEEGCIIFLVTASSEAYMKYTDLPVDVLIGTKTENGHIIGRNCKGVSKVERIEAYLKDHQMIIDYEHSYGYSDSRHDIPMLNLVKNRFKVDKKDGHLSPFIY